MPEPVKYYDEGVIYGVLTSWIEDGESHARLTRGERSEGASACVASGLRIRNGAESVTKPQAILKDGERQVTS